METLGLIAAVVMPFWNIPLIIRIGQRKSADDISLTWVLGVFVCILLMLPSGLASPDRVFRTFAILNTFFFGAVAVQVIRYRRR